jgi:hypothetical protein
VITIEVIKYYGLGNSHGLLSAQDKLDALRKKHPDRQYALLRNMRGHYDRFQVVQLQMVRVDWPEPADVGLPPEPTQPASGQSWEDFHYEQTKWRDAWVKATRPIKAKLSAKLNP